MSAPYTLLGTGGYGIAFKPALPNTIEGTLTNFPENITKVFYDFSNMNQAITQLEAIPNDIGFNKYIEPYKKNIKRRNLPSFARNELATHGINMNNNVAAVHVHDLGVDFNKLSNAEFQTPVRAIPLRSIVSEMKKLMEQVSRLLAAGFIHGDIRGPNVLIHPTTGVMNIIDFDWLSTRDDFYTNYSTHFGFYSNPPECIFVLAVPHTKPINESITVRYPYSSSVQRKLREYVGNFFRQSWAKLVYPDSATLSSTLNDSIDSFLDGLSTLSTNDGTLNESEYYTTYKKLVLDSFDSFGLAGALLEFIAKVYTVNGFNPMVHSCEEYIANGGVLNTEDCVLLKQVCDILLRMANLSVAIRIDIDDALEEMNELLGIAEEIPVPVRGRTRRHRKRKHRGTRRRHYRGFKGKGKK